MIDGNQAMPHTVPDEPGQGIKRTYLDYSDGMYTGIGGGSVGVPGILAAVRRAWERHGDIDWEALFAPAIRAARDGFPFPVTSAYYLSVTWNEIWSLYPEAREIFSQRRRAAEGRRQLRATATRGVTEPDRRRGAAHVLQGDARREDVRCDQRPTAASWRSPTSSITRRWFARRSARSSFGWRIDCNPPPASGGAVAGPAAGPARERRLDDPVDSPPRDRRGSAIALRPWRSKDKRTRTRSSRKNSKRHPIQNRSPDTTHTSSADADGYACSITESNGYGAGLVVDGMLLNNTLGEEELNPLGVHGLQPGRALSLEHGADDRHRSFRRARRRARLAGCDADRRSRIAGIHPDRGGRRRARRGRRRAARSPRSTRDRAERSVTSPASPATRPRASSSGRTTRSTCTSEPCRPPP